FPAVRRRHRRVHVDAGGEFFFDERSRDLIRSRVIRHRRQHNDNIGHKRLVLSSQLLYCLSRVTRRTQNSEPGTENRRTRTRHPKPETRNPKGLRLLHWLLLFIASLIVVDGLVGDRGLLAILRARHEYDELANTIARQRGGNA